MNVLFPSLAFLAAGGGEPEPCALWEAPEILFTDSGPLVAPLLADSSGDVWVVDRHFDGDYQLQVRASVGTSGAWQPLGPALDMPGLGHPDATIDGDDVLTVVYRHDLPGEAEELHAVRYTPGAGWGALELLESMPSSFTGFEVAADDAGNAIAAVAGDDFAGRGTWVCAYDGEKGSWGSAVLVSPPGEETVLPTLVCAPAGAAVYLFYAVDEGGAAGIYAHLWQAEARVFGPAELVPGTESNFIESSGGVTGRVLAAVGSDGEATLLWQAAIDEPLGYVTMGSRTQGGVWQPASELQPLSPNPLGLVGRGDVTTNSAGDVLAAAHRFETSQISHFYAFRYYVGEGWQPTLLAHANGGSFSSVPEVSWTVGRRAVSVVNDNVLGPPLGLESVSFNGAEWSTVLLDLPDEGFGFAYDLLAVDGEVVCVYELGPSSITSATWLRGTSAFSELGHALAGTGGRPPAARAGCELVGGEPVTFSLANALEDTTAILVLGLERQDLPLLGGVLVPTADAVLANLPTSSEGTLDVTLAWPPGLPPGTTLYSQYWVVDPGGPEGFAASNGLAGTEL